MGRLNGISLAFFVVRCNMVSRVRIQLSFALQHQIGASLPHTGRSVGKFLTEAFVPVAEKSPRQLDFGRMQPSFIRLKPGIALRKIDFA